MATNFSTGTGLTVNPYFTNDSANVRFAVCTVANLPTSTAGYAISCLIAASDTGALYINTGTTTSATWTLLDTASASLTLPAAATDATTTTGTSLALTMNTVTTGNGETISVNGLTVGKGFSITHTTSVIANGGSLMNVSSTGIDTSTTTGVLENFSSTASLAGTQVLWTFSGLTTGLGLSIVNAAQTTGDAIKITTASATSGGGIVIQTSSSNALAIGLNGKTNPAFSVDSSTASQAAGLKITGAATGGTVAVALQDSGADTSLTIDGKGVGVIGIGNTSTGQVSLGRGARKSLIIGNTVTSLSAQSVTPTAAQLRGGQIKHVTATGAGTFTLDTGANITATDSGVAVGDSFTCLLINSGSQTSTITTAASGTTLFGTAAVTTGKTALMTFSNTGSNTWDVYITVSA